MNLSNYCLARAKFFSPLESIGDFNMVGEDINENMTLRVKDLKGLLSYFSAVLTKEPILNDVANIMTPGTKIANEDLSYDTFLKTTKLNDNISFYFQATTFANKASLTFSDIGLLGESNTYKPFNSQDATVIDSMITASLDDIRQFSDNNFKFKKYRGTAAFDRVSIHPKGYTIYLTDKQLYMTIIASKYTTKTGVTSYIAIMYIGDDDA